MKVTVVFEDFKVVVPCNKKKQVRKLMEDAVIRYNRITNKESPHIKTLCLQGGGILDPDDVIADVIDDAEEVWAVCDIRVETIMNNINNNHVDDNNNNNNNNLIYNNKNNEINNNNNNNNKKDNKENCQVKNEVNNNSYFENINQIDDRNNKEDKNIDEINANSNENYGKNYLYANDTKINSNQNMKAELHKNSTTFLEDNGKAKFEFKKNFTEVNHSHNHSFENTYTHTSEHQNDAVNIVTNDDSIERVKMHSNITTNAHDGTNTKIHTDIEARDIKSQSLLSHIIFSNDFDTIYSNVDKKTTNSNKTDMNHIGVSNNLDDGLRHESAQTNVLDEYCVSVTQEDFLKESSLKCKTLSDPELFKSGGDVDAYEQQTDENNNHIDLYGNKQSGKNSGIDENEKYDLSISKYLIGQHKEHEEGEGGKKGKEGKGMKDHQFGVFTDYSEDDEEDDEDEDDDENLLFLFQSDERNAQIVNLQTDGRPIGLHVRPLFVNKRQEKIRGLEVRWKETNTVAERETNINVGDIIIEVNNISLFNVPASMAKEIFKDAMERSEMRLKVLCVERQVLHKSMKDLRDPSDTKEIFNPAFKSVSLSDMNNTLYNNNNNNFNNKNNDFNNNNNIINANELYTSKNYDSNEVVHNIGVDSYSPVNLPDYDLYNHLNKNNMNNKNDKINNNNNNNNFITSQVGDDNVFAVKERYVYDLPDNVYRHINNNNNQNNKNNNNNNNKISRSESLIKAMDKCLEDSPVYAVPTSIKKNKPRWWSRLIQKKKKGKGEATVTKEASSQTDKTVFKQNHNNVQNRKNDNNNNNNMSNKNISNINNIPNNNLYNYKTNIKNNVNNIKNNNKYGNNANNYNNNNNMNDNNNAYYNNNNNNNNDNNNNNTPYIVKNTIEETIRSNDIVQVENESGNKVYDKNGKNTNTLNTNNTKADDDLINYNNTNENFVKSDFSNKENNENVNFLNLNYIINNNDNNNQNNNNNSSRNNNNKKINDNNDIINNHKINTSFSDGTNRNTYISNRDNDDYRVDSNKNIKVEKNININKTNGSSNTNNITNNNNNNNKDSIKNTSNIIKMHNTNNDVREIQKDVALNSQAKINQHRSNKSELKSDVQGKTFKISQNIFDEVKNPTKESYRPLNPPGINDCNSSKSIKTGGNCSNFTYNNYQQQQRVQNVFSNHNFALSKQQLPEKERQLPHQNQNQHIIHYQQSQNQQQTQHQWQQPYKQQNSKQKPQQTVKSLKQLNTKSTKQQEYLEADSDSHQHMRQESDGIFYQGSYSYNPKNNKSFGAISKRRINDVNNSSGSQAYDVKLKSKSALNLTEQLREKLQNSNNKQEGTRSFNLANKQLQNYTKQNILTKNISSYSQQPQNTSHNKYEKPMYNNHLHTNVHNNAFKNPNLPNDRPLSDQFYFDQPISDYFQTDRPISDQLRSHYPFKLDSYSKEIEKQNKIKRNTKQHQQKMTHQNQQKDLRQHPQQHHLSKEAFYRSAETDLLMKQTSQQIQQTKQQIKMLQQQQQLLRQSKYK